MTGTAGGGLVRVTERVWVWPHHPDPDRVQASVGIVAGDDGCVIVDAGHSPALARRVRGEVMAAGLPEPHALVYTHHHWDHVWGAQEWAAPVVAHELAAAALRVDAGRPWSEAYLRDEIARDARYAPSYTARIRAMAGGWDGFRIVPPDVTFTAGHRIELGGVTVALEHVGGGHCPDSTVVRVPSEGVLFLGDCYYPPPFHLREPGDGLDLDLVRRLVTDDYAWYVESHDVPHHRTDVEWMLAENTGR